MMSLCIALVCATSAGLHHIHSITVRCAAD